MFPHAIRLFALLLGATVLAGCSSGPPVAKYGVSWRLSQSSSPHASTLAAAHRSANSINDSPQSSTYIGIPWPGTADYCTVGLKSWKEVNGVRTYVPANWSTSDPSVGMLSDTAMVAETSFIPARPGTTKVFANIEGVVVAVDVTVFRAVYIQSTHLRPDWETGFAFATGTPTADTASADIFIQPSDGVVQVPGGFVRVDASYLHEVTTVPDMAGASYSFPTDVMTGAQPPVGQICVVATRQGKHVAFQLVGTMMTRLDGGGYSYSCSFIYRPLD